MANKGTANIKAAGVEDVEAVEEDSMASKGEIWEASGTNHPPTP